MMDKTQEVMNRMDQLRARAGRMNVNHGVDGLPSNVAVLKQLRVELDELIAFAEAE